MSIQNQLEVIKREVHSILQSLSKGYNGCVRESVSDLLKAVKEIEAELKPTNNPPALDWPHAPGRDIVGDAPRRPARPGFERFRDLGIEAYRSPETSDMTPEQVQWQNIQTVMRAVAQHCFGNAGSETRVSCGAAFTAVVNSTTAKDGAKFNLQPLPSPQMSIQVQENADRWLEVLKVVSDREVMFAGFPAQAFSLIQLKVDHSVDISQNTAIHFTDAIDKSRQRHAST